MPPINFNILDGQLGQVPASIANAIVQAGVCASGVVDQVYALSNPSTASSTLGPGPLTEAAADTIAVAGACYACPINPSAAGSMAAVVHTGTGSGTMTATLAPAVTLKAKITTGGVRGTAAIAFSLNGGAYSTPVLTAATILVPGTLTVLSISSQTYTLNDVWTFNTDGTSSISGSGTLGWITQASSPLDAFDVFATITTAGALATAMFTVSVDGQNGNSISSPILTSGGGIYVIPNTGIVLTFAGTFVAGDTYESLATPAGFSGGDVTAALTAIGNSSNTFVGIHINGEGANSAAAASLAATVDTSLTAFATAYRFVFAMVDCPYVESDATVEAAFASTVSNRVMVTCTPVLHTSSLSGRKIWRNCGVPISSRLASINPSVDPGWVGGGALANVTNTRRDDSKLAQSFVNNRITCITTVPTKIGFFSSTGVMLAQGGSDFSSVMNRRVMDVACTTTLAAVVNILNQAILANPQTGGIYDPTASTIEGNVVGALNIALVAKSPPDATKCTATVDRSINLLATGELSITIGIIPLGYAHTINVTLGFVNPAFG